MMSPDTRLFQDTDYKKSRLKNLKKKVLQTQIKAAVKVSTTLLQFYWELGKEIVLRQAQSSRGDGFLKQLSQDLMAEFRDMKGFSFSNTKYIRQWVVFYSQEKAISQQLVGQLTQIPWGHNLKIIAYCQSIEEAPYYVQNTLENGWSKRRMGKGLPCPSFLEHGGFLFKNSEYKSRLHLTIPLQLMIAG